MPDPVNQANELRLLEQKRLRAGLTPEEEARRATLSSGAGAPARTRGFDVRAAAAEVHALLEPAAAPLGTSASAPSEAAWAGGAVPLAPPAEGPPASWAGAQDLDADAQGVAPAENAANPDPPVYDAAAYGLDPNDPNDAAWAAWYAEQGWDPATAYAYAQQSSAQYDGDPNAGHADPGTLPLDAAGYPQDPSLAHDPNEPFSACEADPAASPAAGELPIAWESAPASPVPYEADALTACDPADPGPAEALGSVEGGVPVWDLDGRAGTAGDVPLPSAAPGEGSEMLEHPSSDSPFAHFGRRDGGSGAERRSLPPAEVELRESGARPETALTRLELRLRARRTAKGESEERADSPDGGATDDLLASSPARAVAVPAGPDVVPEMPPAVDLGELGVPIDPLDAPAADFPVEIGLAFEADAAPEEDGAAPFPDVAWAEHAVPESDRPVDFAAFDAEPQIDQAKEEGLVAESTALWELPGSKAQAPALDFPVGEQDRCPEAAAAFPEAALQGELIEILDDDIIEVTELVVDPEPPAVPETLSPVGSAPARAVAPLAAGDAAPVAVEQILSPLRRQPAQAVEAPSPIVLAAQGLEHAPRPPVEEEAVAPEPMPEPAAVAAPEPVELPVPASCVAGTHRVVIHTADGQVKRGTVSDLALDAGEVLVACQAGGAAEAVPVENIKAIFFMLPPGDPPPSAEGKKVRVTFRDGRQVAGFSSDYAPERPGFFMVPADARTHTARIWVYRTAVRQVSVS